MTKALGFCCPMQDCAVVGVDIFAQAHLELTWGGQCGAEAREDSLEPEPSRGCAGCPEL